MAVSQQQKVDFLLKKLGFTKTKTGLAVDSTLTGTKKAGFAEAIPSPLIIANSSVWNEADSIPTTPPGSNTNQVRVYLAASSGHRMTVDSTVANNRAFIAFSTYNDTSSTRLNNWIDTQFGAGYLIKVFKGDPNSGGVQLSAAGSGANDGWFFDYSAGVLNFNDTNVPSGVTGTNIYVVGYRYIGQTGAPTSGISTFSFLDLSVERNLDVGVQGGISTFRNNIDANGIIEGVAGENKIPFLYSDLASLPSAGTYHGMFAHVHSEGRGYFAHAGNWLELVNKDTSGNVGLSGDLDVDGHTNLDNVSVAGVSTFTGAIDANGDLDVDGHTNLDNVSIAGVTTFQSSFVRMAPGGGDSGILKFGSGNNYQIIAQSDKLQFAVAAGKSIELNDGNSVYLRTSNTGIDITGGLTVSGISTFTGAIDANGDLDVDGHTNLDNVSIAGVTTFSEGLFIPDDKKLEIGNAAGNGDLQLYYDSTPGESFISHTGPGVFKITGNGANDLFIRPKSDENSIVAKANAQVELYFNAEKRFETSSVGVSIPQDLDVDGHTNLDNVSIAGVSTFAGAIDLNADLDVDGHTELDNVNITGFTTFATGTRFFHHTPQIHMQGSNTATLSFVNATTGTTAGTDGMLMGFSSSSQVGFINVNESGHGFVLKTGGTAQSDERIRVSGVGTFSIRNGTEEMVNARPNAAVELYHNGIKRLETSSVGVSIPQDLDVDGHTNLDNVSIAGFTTITQDLDVDGHTNLDNVSIAGVTSVASLTSGRVVLAGTGGKLEDSNKLTFDGTTLGLTGNANVTGNLTVGGVLTYEDVKNVDAVGLITARSGIRVTSGVIEAQAGENKIPSLYSAMGNLPSAGSYHGMFAHVHATGRGYFAHAGNWLELVNREINGVVGTGTETYNIGNLVSTSSTTTSLNVSGVTTTVTLDVNGDLDVDGHTNLDNVSIAGVTTITSSASSALYVAGRTVLGNNTNLPTFNAATLLAVANLTGNNNFVDMTILGGRTGRSMVKFGDQDNKETGSIQYHHSDDSLKFFTNASSTERLIIKSTGNIEITNDLDVDGHTNLDNVSIAGVTTFAGAIDANGNLDVAGAATLGSGASGAVTLQHQGATKLNTATWGVSVWGVLQANNLEASNGYVWIKHDNQPLKIGVGADLQLIHNGSESFINNHTSNLNINAPTVSISTNFSVGGISTFSGNVDINADIDVDGHTNLDNVSVAGFSTFSSGIHLNADVNSASSTSRLYIGVGQDLELFHDGANSYVRNHTGNLLLSDTNHTYFKGFTSDKSAACLFNNSVKLQTTNEGILVSGGTTTGTLNVTGISTFAGNIDANGDLDVDGHTNLDNVSIAGVTTATGLVGFGTHVTLQDGAQIRLGEKVSGGNRVGDFIISHDTSMFGDTYNRIDSNNGNMWIVNRDTVKKYMYIRSNDIQLRDWSNNEAYIHCKKDAEVVLYYNGSQKLETTNTGIDVTGNVVSDGLVIDGNTDLNGDIDVDGHTNLDNVNIAGVTTFAGNVDINADIDVDGHTELDNVNVAGVTTFNDNVHLKLNDRLYFGNGNELEIYQQGNNSFIKNNDDTFIIMQGGSATNYPMKIYGGNEFQLRHYHSNGGQNSVFTSVRGGAFTLYHAAPNTPSAEHVRLETTSTGLNFPRDIDVDGHTNLDNVSIAGVTTFAGAIDLNADLDVDGHTNLDNVSIAGVSTFTGAIDANGNLDVDGHTNLDNVSVAGVTTFTSTAEFDSNAKFDSTITAGGSTGTNGQYLKSTGSGVAWESFPTLRSRDTIVASAGQTSFTFNYNVNFIDVFVNGIKLTDSEFTATNGTSVVLAVGCFVGDIVELVSYSTISSGGGGGGTLNNIVEDTSPQLGGNLDLFNKSITGTGNVNITGIISATTFKGPSGVTATFIGDGSGLTGITASGSGVVVKDSDNTVGTAGTINFGNNLSVSAASAGIVTITASSVGITTINGVASIANDLDVDGHTNLDNVNIVGVTTVNGNIDLSTGSDPFIKMKNIHNRSKYYVWSSPQYAIGADQSSYGGLETSTEVMTFQMPNIDNGGWLFLDSAHSSSGGVMALTTLGEMTVAHSLRLGYGTGDTTTPGATDRLDVNGSIKATGADINGDLDVDGHTNLDNVNVGGATTTTGVVVISAGTQSTNTTSGALRVAGGVGVVKNVNVGGDLDVDGHTNLDNVNIAGVVTATTFKGALEATSASFSSNIDANGNLDVAGTATLGSGGSGQSILQYQGTTRLKTEVDRIDTFGHLNVGGNVDNALLRLGQSNDLVLTHDGDQSFINNLTSNLNINAPTVVVGTGLSVGGISTFTGAIDANGDLDVDGHTNLDNVSIAGVTTHQGLFKLPDSTNNQTGRLMLGTGTDLQIFHTGSAGEIGNFTGNLNIKSNSFRLFNGGANQLYIKADQNDSVVLYHSNNEKFRTTNTGAVVTGILTATTFSGAFSGDGSGLTGVTASGSGVVVKHDGSTVGTAGTINFSTNLDVSAISAGIVTITASGGGVTSDAQENTVGGTNAGDSFDGTNALRNTLFGYNAGTSITSADDGTAVGHNALGSMAGGARNTAFGAGAGSNITNSDNNTCIGYNAGNTGGSGNLTNGVNCILLGYEARPTATNASNEVTIGNDQITKFRVPGINFILKDNGGTPTQGHVLTVDANGEAGFAAASGGGSGISTISGVVNIANDLDVDGHTNLDNVSISGVSTVAGNCSFAGGNVTMTASGSPNSLNVSGTSRFEIASMENAVLDGEIAHTGDTHTLIKFPSNDNISFDTGGTTRLNINNSGATVTGTLAATAVTGDGSGLTGVQSNVGITTNLSGTFTASAGSPSTINTFGYGSGDIVVEYTVFIKNGSDFQSQKLLAMRDGTTVHSSQFAVMYSSSLLVQLDATISSGNILLRATPETGVSGSTTYKIKREVM